MNLSQSTLKISRSLSGKGAHKRGELFMQKLSGPKAAAHRLHAVFHVFGAGNLIFPPDLGAKAGIHFWPAFLGLAISAVGLPLPEWWLWPGPGSGKAGRPGAPGVCPGLYDPDLPVHWPLPGPPRTASTSFAMLAPLVGTGAGLQLGYSVVFFATAFLVALQPEKLTRWLGRLLCPCLLVLILVLFGGCPAAPPGRAVRHPHPGVYLWCRITGRIVWLPDHGHPGSP